MKSFDLEDDVASCQVNVVEKLAEPIVDNDGRLDDLPSRDDSLDEYSPLANTMKTAGIGLKKHWAKITVGTKVER